MVKARRRVRRGWLLLAVIALLGAVVGTQFRSSVCTDYAAGGGTCTSSSPVGFVLLGVGLALYSFYRAVRQER